MLVSVISVCPSLGCAKSLILFLFLCLAKQLALSVSEGRFLVVEEVRGGCLGCLRSTLLLGGVVSSLCLGLGLWLFKFAERANVRSLFGKHSIGSK